MTMNALAPTFKARFVFYGIFEGEHWPEYIIERSDEPALPKQGTVSAEELLENGKPIPPTPTFETWLSLTGKKQRCPKCWAALRTFHDYIRHQMVVHNIIPKGDHV